MPWSYLKWPDRQREYCRTGSAHRRGRENRRIILDLKDMTLTRFDRIQSEIPGIADRSNEGRTGGLRCIDPGRNGDLKRSDCESHS